MVLATAPGDEARSASMSARNTCRVRRRRRRFRARIAGAADPLRGLAAADLRVRAGIPLRPRALVPNCLILDVNLPDLNGLDLQKLVSVERTDMPIIFVTGYGDVPMTVKAMKAGAVEFLTKPFGDDVLLAAIEQALERSRTALALDSEMRALRERHASLSRREQEVMALVVAGLLNKQVGFELGISEITVKAHRGRSCGRCRPARSPNWWLWPRGLALQLASNA